MADADFKRDEFAILDGFVGMQECEVLLASIKAYRANHNVPLVERQMRDRSLRYFVIDGHALDRVKESPIARVHDIARRVRRVVSDLEGEELVPLENERVALNINITPPGGEYRWHYDRNAVTAILFLNTVPGGVLEMFPRCRWLLQSWSHTWLQKLLDGICKAFRQWISRKIVVTPSPGRLAIMRGHRCLHSVTEVLGAADRINIIMAFDRPGVSFRFEEGLDKYLYSQKSVASSDPNYV